VSRFGLVIEVFFWGFLSWLYGGDLVLLGRAAGAPVAAVDVLPSLPLALFGAVLAVSGVALLVLGALGRIARGGRLQRVVRGAGAVLLFVDLVLLSPGALTLGAERQQLMVLEEFTKEAQGRSSREAVLTDRAALESIAAGLGSTPLLVGGERVLSWRVQVRPRCMGPTGELAGASVGTIVYCIAPDAQRAWVWLVSLPQGQHFGTVAPFGLEGRALGQVSTRAVAPPDPEDRAEPNSVWGAPTLPGE
jgi:hypothetical protein